MKIQKLCKTCEESFIAIKTTQEFCCRKCFKKNYYLCTKKRLLEEQRNPVYPKKTCSFCYKETILNFDPVKSPHLFSSFKCPFCNVTNKMIWNNLYEPHSRQIIFDLISSSLRTITIEKTVEISKSPVFILTKKTKVVEFQTTYPVLLA